MIENTIHLKTKLKDLKKGFFTKTQMVGVKDAITLLMTAENKRIKNECVTQVKDKVCRNYFTTPEIIAFLKGLEYTNTDAILTYFDYELTSVK